jgi:hypothetical protein
VVAKARDAARQCKMTVQTRLHICQTALLVSFSSRSMHACAVGSAALVCQSSCVCSQLLGQPVGLRELEEMQPTLGRSLRALLSVSEGEVSGMPGVISVLVGCWHSTGSTQASNAVLSRTSHVINGA